MRSLDWIEKEYRKKKLPRFDIGDSVDVHVKIIEGERERDMEVSLTWRLERPAEEGEGVVETEHVVAVLRNRWHG